MMATGQDFSQILHEQLLCHICESGLKAGKHHWYRCTQGHMVCQDCKETLKKNCSCKKPLLSEPCTLIKALLSANKMQFKCENHAEGCQKLLDKENMTFHHAECLFRIVQCPRIPCHSFVPFYLLLDHMKSQEKIFLLKKDQCYNVDVYQTSFGKKVKAIHWINMTTAYGSSIPLKFEIEDNAFFTVAKQTNGAFYHWVHFFGSRQEAKNFSCTLEYLHKATAKVVMTQTSEVFSVDDTADSIIEDGKCVGMSSKAFCANMVKYGCNRFEFNLEIRNLKEEVKDENIESGVSDIDE